MGFTDGMSPADLAAVTGNNNDGFAGNGAWWIIILFLFAFIGGWNNNGYGRNGSGVGENYTLISDMGQMERKIDGVYSGICDSTFALNNTITNGFAAAQNTMTQGFAGLNTGMVQQGYETRIGIQGIGTQLADCCCKTQQNIKDTQYVIGSNVADLKYTIAQGNCNLGNQMQMSTRDITENANANTKAILDFLVNDKVSTLQRENDSLRLAASQAAQNSYLIGALRPAPVPAYPVANPYCNCNCNC